MESEHTGDTVSRVREAVERAVATDGLRPVAREVGMSPSGLQKFLGGGRPYATTWRKLRDWHEKVDPSPPAPAAADMMLGPLLGDFPPSRRDTLRRELVQLLRSAYRRSGIEIPPWLSGPDR